MRETIIDGINFSPARDRYKIFIIDEVHQLSKPAFNALLKTLEEPPDNVVFMMATTELHKVPETILSRCQEFEFRTISLQKIFSRLKLIADAEKIDISDDALRELARSGMGSMRDAQSNFDQVISFSGETIGSEDVTHALGLAGVDVLTKVAAALADRDGRQMLAIVDDLTARGHDLRNFCRDILGLFRDLMVLKVGDGSPELLDSAVLGIDEMRAIADGFTPSDLLRFFNSLCETETKLFEATQSRYVLEVGLMKLVEMRSVTTVEALLERLDQLQGMSSTPAVPMSKAADAASEKKTLNIEVEAAAEPVPLADDPVAGKPEAAVAEPPPVVRSVPSLPLTLASLSREELEHIDYEELDTAYEKALLESGDDLAPIAGIETWTGFAPSPPLTDVHNAMPRSNGAAAFAPASEPDIDGDELPQLSSDPSEEELLEYASAHPLVKRAVRVFRAKIVAVTKE